MQPTLITDFEHNTSWLKDLKRILEVHPTESLNLSIWVRDKALPTSDLPVDSLRHLAGSQKLQLHWSWCHRNQAQRHEWLHIPDQPELRDASIKAAGRRVLSCHSLEHANALLTAHPLDHVLISPWAPSLSKTHRKPLLNRNEVLDLAIRFPQRIHLVSGVTPNDFSQLDHYPFASLCLLGALRDDMASCLEQLQALYRATSLPR